MQHLTGLAESIESAPSILDMSGDMTGEMANLATEDNW